MSRNALSWTTVISIFNWWLYFNVYVAHYCPLLALYAYQLFWECFIKVGYIQYVKVSMSMCVLSMFLCSWMTFGNDFRTACIWKQHFDGQLPNWLKIRYWWNGDDSYHEVMKLILGQGSRKFVCEDWQSLILGNLRFVSSLWKWISNQGWFA